MTSPLHVVHRSSSSLRAADPTLPGMMTFDEFREVWRDRLRDDAEAMDVLERSRDKRRGWVVWDDATIQLRRGWPEWTGE